MAARKTGWKITSAVLLTLLVLFVAFPLYWAVTIAIRPGADLFERRIFPSSFTLESFRELIFEKSWAGFEAVSFLVPLRNSLVVSISSTILALLVAIPGAYGMARLPIKGKEIISTYVLLAYVFPPFILITALYAMVNVVGARDSLMGLSVLNLVIVVPYSTWTLRGYFLTVPKELEEAGTMDGCTRMQNLLRVILPVTGPGLVGAAIFSFTLSWQNLLFALLTLDSHIKFTLPIALSSMVIGDFVKWGALMAAVFVSILPPMLLYLLMQRYVVQGLTAGSVKG